MADVVIIRSPDKETAAARLATSLAAAGYDVGALEVEDPARLVEAVEGCTADAAILIWSRSLVFHVLHSGELPRIRQLRNLIEVSADGITPPSRVDDSRVVLISGWRGQPFHPGWQRLQAELKRLGGSPRSIAETPRAAAAASNAHSQPAASAAPRGPARPPLRLLLGGAAAVAAVGAVLGAVSWSGDRAPEDRPRQEVSRPRAAAPIVTQAPVETATRPASEPAAEASPPPLPDPAPAPEVPAPGPVKPPPKGLREHPVVRPARPAGDAAGPSAKAGESKKYSRKNSKIMRQFCERSGRSTPQCKTFLRSVGNP
ncbi:MAG: hypothetical protein QOJ91_2600 [Sphingomonadales bacterium]|jgi:hypothetical protein|nr:hypothetical protein [Sphingomonadales bacterium]